MNNLQNAASRYEDFKVDTEMKDVEILHITESRILAKGKRFGRVWFLRALPPEERGSAVALRGLREEFDRRFASREAGMPLTVGIENIDGLGPCIVEEWQEDKPSEGKETNPKRKAARRKGFLFAGILIVIAGAVFAGIHIHRLTALAEESRAQLAALHETNREQEKKMSQLADSLEIVIQNALMPDKSGEFKGLMELDEDEKMALELYNAKIKAFDKELERYDKKVIPKVINNISIYYDSVAAHFHHIITMAKDVDPEGRFPQLPEDERIRLICRLREGFELRTLPYFRKWSPQAWGIYKKKKEKREAERKDSTKRKESTK